MSSKKVFRRRVRREIAVRIQEMQDGCLECRACRGLCHQHWKEAVALTLDPRKHLGMETAKDES